MRRRQLLDMEDNIMHGFRTGGRGTEPFGGEPSIHGGEPIDVIRGTEPIEGPRGHEPTVGTEPVIQLEF